MCMKSKRVVLGGSVHIDCILKKDGQHFISLNINNGNWIFWCCPEDACQQFCVAAQAEPLGG